MDKVHGYYVNRDGLEVAAKEFYMADTDLMIQVETKTGRTVNLLFAAFVKEFRLVDVGWVR